MMTNEELTKIEKDIQSLVDQKAESSNPEWSLTASLLYGYTQKLIKELKGDNNT